MNNHLRTYSLDRIEVQKREGVEPPKLTGYASVFNSYSYDFGGWVEVVLPGAFDRSLAENDVRALAHHDKQQVLGRLSVETLKLWTDQKGLGFEVLLPDTTYAWNLLESIKRGDIDGCSIGFHFRKHHWETRDNQEVHVVEDVDLQEVSIGVTWQAFPEAKVQLRDLHEAYESRKLRRQREINTRICEILELETR